MTPEWPESPDDKPDPALEPLLRAAGFVPTPKGLVRYA